MYEILREELTHFVVVVAKPKFYTRAWFFWEEFYLII